MWGAWAFLVFLRVDLVQFVVVVYDLCRRKRLGDGECWAGLIYIATLPDVGGRLACRSAWASGSCCGSVLINVYCSLAPTSFGAHIKRRLHNETQLPKEGTTLQP